MGQTIIFKGVEKKKNKKKSTLTTKRTTVEYTCHTNRKRTQHDFQWHSEQAFFDVIMHHMQRMKGASASHAPSGAPHKHVIFYFLFFYLVNYQGVPELFL
jgi:hypothetical protein